MKKSAIFLDRDGVINRNCPDYVKSWSEFEFLPGVLEALRRLAATPHSIVIVSNQSAVGRGLVPRDTIEEIHFLMVQVIRQAGGRIDAIYYCPHDPVDGCKCRKPLPGLLLQGAEELNLDLAASLLIGDSLSDLEAALDAGVHPILVQTNHVKTVLPKSMLGQVLVFNDLEHVVDTLGKRLGRLEMAPSV